MGNTEIDFDALHVSFYNRMKKLTDAELRREFESVRNYPRGTKHEEVMKMKMQMLEILAKERGILL